MPCSKFNHRFSTTQVFRQIPRPPHRLLALIIWTVLCLAAEIWLQGMEEKHLHLPALLVCYATALSPVLFLKKCGCKLYLTVLTATVSATLWLYAVLTLHFRIKVTGDLFFILLSSSGTECLEFLRETGIRNLVCSGLPVMLLYGVFITVIWREQQPLCLRKRSAGAALSALLFLTALGCSMASSAFHRSTVWIQTAWEFAIFRHNQRALIAMERSPELPAGLRRSPELPGNLCIVIVIGESATRRHHGIFGYSRNTTPQLAQACAGNELLLFHNVISASSVTGSALRYLLTPCTLHDKWHAGYTLFDCYNAAGFRTALFSNQYRWGEYDSPTTLLAAHAGKRVYIREQGDPWSTDEAVLPFFRSWIQAHGQPFAPRMAVIHLMGSHARYSLRYPESWAPFTGQFSDPAIRRYPTAKLRRRINRYDNSIAYTDHVIGMIINELRCYSGPVCLLYLPDHGAAPYLTGGKDHTPDSTERECYEIPMLLWVNPSYRTLFPEVIEAAEKHSGTPLQTDALLTGLLALGGITTPELPAESNFFSPAFRPAPHRHIREGLEEY